MSWLSTHLHSALNKSPFLLCHSSVMRLIMGQKRQKCQKRQTGKNKPNTFAPPSVSAASAVPDVSDIRDISDFADLRRATPENRKALEQFLM